MTLELLKQNLFTPTAENPEILKGSLTTALTFHPLKHEIETLCKHGVLYMMEEMGGFLAGGVLRKLYARKEPVFNRGFNSETYFTNGGDIDLFFESNRCFRYWEDTHLQQTESKFCQIYSRLKRKENIIEKNARHYEIKYPFVTSNGLENRKVTLQAVVSRYGTPVQVLSTFDIVNSMIATDGKTLWIHRRALENEQNRRLSINADCTLESKNLMYRVGKYINLHGYDSFDQDNGSLKTLAGWCGKYLNPEAMKKYSEEDRTGFSQQVEIFNKFLLDSTEAMIPREQMYMFGGISRLPRIVPLTGSSDGGNIAPYRHSKVYVHDGECDAALAALLYRDMVAAGGTLNKPITKITEVLKANPFGYGGDQAYESFGNKSKKQVNSFEY